MHHYNSSYQEAESIQPHAPNRYIANARRPQGVSRERSKGSNLSAGEGATPKVEISVKPEIVV